MLFEPDREVGLDRISGPDFVKVDRRYSGRPRSMFSWGTPQKTRLALGLRPEVSRCGQI